MLTTEAKTQVDPNYPLKKIRKSIKKDINGPQALKLKKFHRKFMMIDLYQKNDARFLFDAVKFEKKVRDDARKTPDNH